MKHLDLFSGIGGFALAAQWVWGKDHEIVAFCEIDKFCQKVLKKHWPDVPICEDIKELTNEWIDTNCEGNGLQRRGMAQSGQENQFTRNNESKTQIDILTGGFPCQPFSCAGKQRGKDDDRALWPEMFRVIKEVRPRWIIGENVAGFVNMALDECITDLEMEGYEVQPYIVPACAVNAPHRRDRVWIVAHNGNWNSRQRKNACNAIGGGLSGDTRRRAGQELVAFRILAPSAAVDLRASGCSTSIKECGHGKVSAFPQDRRTRSAADG